VEILNATPAHRIRMIRRMHPFLPAVLLMLFLTFVPRTIIAGESFSGSRAYAVLQRLAGEIGPRPMGSPAEQQALAFAESTFAASGCDTAYIMAMTSPGGVNTTSGIAVGILRGATDRIILIGGHIDSSSPEVPGANDDGSGAACVMELARVLGKRDLQSTIVFACFGGEEEGLHGSTWFVEHFDRIDSIALMLQIDMADGASYLELDPDAPDQVSAPRWLPEAALGIYTAQRSDGALRYLTHMSTLNASTPGGTGSDHIPFLQRGIPAIDFTSDISYPIHSPLDNLATFDSSGLARSGALVLGLVERFDGGVPSRATEKYYLLQFGGRLFFVTHPVLLGFSGIAVILSVVAFNVLRRKRISDRTGQPKLSGLKLTLFALIVQAFVWLPESIIGLVKGYRFPWVNNIQSFVVLAVVGGLVGLWVVLRMAQRLRIQQDPFPLFFRFFVITFGAWFGSVLLSPEIALYVAWPLFWISLAVLLRPGWSKGAAFLIGVALPLRIIFVEPFGFLLRAMSGSPFESVLRDGVTDGFYILGFGLLSLPAVFGGAAVFRSAAGEGWSLERFRSARSLIVLSAIFAVLAGYIFTTSVYSRDWQPLVRIEQKYTMGSDSTTIRISGSEGAAGLAISTDGGTTTTPITSANFEQTLPRPDMNGWLIYDQTTAVLPDSARPDSLVRLERVVDLDGPLRPLSIELRYQSEKPVTVTSRWAQGSRRRGLSPTGHTGVLSWYAFPEMPLRIPVSLRIARGQIVTESLEVTYDSLAAPMHLVAPQTLVRERFVVTRRDTLRAPGGE
jgi:hypothetical protein